MKNDTKHFEDLSEIRSMMERASKFISLSGISGILAGMIALIGSIIAWWYLYVFIPKNELPVFFTSLSLKAEIIIVLFALACFIFTGALFAAIYFTTRNSKKKNIPVWDFNTKRLLFNLFLPLLVGAIFIIALIMNDLYQIILPASLIFYGLSLINAGHFTYSDIKFLGYFEIVLGLMGLFVADWGFLIWAFGFGVMHIIYGLIMYFKYEK
jgi:hypothetical protein